MESEYRKFPALNSSMLSAFIDSQDKANIQLKPKSYFEDGKIFERLVEDFVTGTHSFEERFFVVDTETPVPEKIASILESGKDLREFYTYKKDNQLSDKYKALHEWLPHCEENPDLFPIQKSWLDSIKIAMENLFIMKIELGDDNGNIAWEGTFEKLMELDPKFQYPIYWERDGIPKKALLDILVVIPDYAPIILDVDMKFMATFKNFETMFRSKYQWQSLHYTEGLRFDSVGINATVWPGIAFAVGTKSEPYLSRCYYGYPEEEEKAIQVYLQHCVECWDWVKAGKPVKGFKDTKRLHYNLRRN